jgi:group I intron endonuclease
MVIYKITNKINGKIYVGKSTTNNENYFGSGISINRALVKYGKENFIREIIENCLSEIELNEREIFWIEELKSTDKMVGYNITKGGDGGNTRLMYDSNQLLDYRNKLSDGVKNSEKYQKSIISKTGVKRPNHSLTMKDMYLKGKLKVGKFTNEISNETKLKISEKNKGKKRTDDTKNKIAQSKYKPVLQFNGDRFVDEFLSIDDASKKCGINRCGISDVCNGRQKTSGGFFWKFK